MVCGRARHLLLLCCWWGGIEGHSGASISAATAACSCLSTARLTTCSSGSVGDAKGVVGLPCVPRNKAEFKRKDWGWWLLGGVLLLLVPTSSGPCMHPGVLKLLVFVPLWKCAFVCV